MIPRTLQSVGLRRAYTIGRSYISVPDILFGKEDVTTQKSVVVAPIIVPTLKTPRSQKVAGRYVSPWTGETNKRLIDVAKYFVHTKRPPLSFSKEVDQLALLKPIDVNRAKMRSVTKPHVSWMGHASCYYQSDGLFFLTDPVWSDRASPVSFAGPKRYINPPIELEDLKIDVVLLSHTHYDHLDMPSARRIGNKAHW